VFFFEKKNQKTFVNNAVRNQTPNLTDEVFFASFCSQKEDFFLSLLTLKAPNHGP